MPVSREEFQESVAKYLEAVARDRRDAAKKTDAVDESQRQNRGSAHLIAAAEHLRSAPDDHVDLSNLHAWEDAQDRVGRYEWKPNDAQADAIRRYADDASGEPDSLLAELNQRR